MKRKKIQNDENYAYSTISKSVTIKGKSLASRNIIQDFSFNNQEFAQAKWINKIFGPKKFIKVFLRLLVPSLFWGLFTALVPILFSTIINAVYEGSKIGNDLAKTVNYTAYAYTYFYPLAGSFLFAAFPAIGNYIGKGNKQKLQEVIRWAAYISFAVYTLGLVLEQVFAEQIAQTLVWGYTNPLSTMQTQKIEWSITLSRYLAFAGFFYIWQWIYVPSLPSMKNSRILFISSVIAFIYFLVAYPAYICATHLNLPIHQKSVTTAEFLHFNGMMSGIGGIYLGFYIIQPLFLLIYTIWPREFKLFQAHWDNLFIFTWNAINRSYYVFQHSSRRKPQKFNKLYEPKPTELEDYSDEERDLLFFSTGFAVSFKMLRKILVLSWSILLDQVLYAVLQIILMTVTINFGGTWNNLNGVVAANAHIGSSMMQSYYKSILFCVTLISTYIYTVYNGFSLLPQYFVAYYLGNRDKETAYHNSLILTNWSIVFGLFLCIVVILYGLGINRTEFAAASGSDYYYLSSGYIAGTYGQLWAIQFNMELIYALAVFFDTAVAMTYYVLVSGGSKFIIFADSLVQVINTAASLALFYTHYDNFYVYYLVNRMHTFLKFALGVAVIYLGGALWGMDVQKGRKIWFNQKLVNLIPLPAIEKVY